MNSRILKIEERVAKLTLAALVVFAPVETYATWHMLGGLRGLVHPSYIVTFTGMLLMLAGAVRSLRARPSPTLLCASHAWMIGYGVRSVFWRVEAVRSGASLTFGVGEMWATIAAVSAGLVLLLTSFALTLRAPAASSDAPSPARRAIETRLAIASAVSLVVFVPIAAVWTWQSGGAAAFAGPYFIAMIVGVGLVAAGVRRSLAARPLRAPGAMCAALAWWAAGGWGATVARAFEISRGATLAWGEAELWLVAAATLAAVSGFAACYYLTWTAGSRPTSRAASPTLV